VSIVDARGNRLANVTADRYGVHVLATGLGLAVYHELADPATGRTIGSASRWADGTWHASVHWTRCVASIGRTFSDLDGCIEAIVYCARTRADA
jgi:hypothetical protein